MAIINWAFQRVAAAGFMPLTTPDLVRASVLEKCGFQPRAENTQVCQLWSGALANSVALLTANPAIVISKRCLVLALPLDISESQGAGGSHSGPTTIWAASAN